MSGSERRTEGPRAATGSVLRIGTGRADSLDPATCVDHEGALVLGLLADPLADYEPGTGRLRPAAARSWDVAPDGRSVSFALRPGVAFHHGRAVTAEDYVYALSRVVRPSTGSQIAYHLSVIEGFEDVRAGRAATLAGVRAAGKLRLEVSLTRPFHEIAAVFSHRVTAAVPRELCEGDPDGAFRQWPAGTGPYRVNRAASDGHRLVLDRFTGYHGANEAHPDGGRGRVDRIEFHYVEDEDTAYEAWRTGGLDLVEITGPRAADARRHEESYHLTPCASLTYLGFPVTVAPFDDPVVRRAVAMGIDRRRLCEEAGGGEFPLARGMVPPRLSGDGTVHTPLDGIGFDPARARALLAERGIRPRKVSVVHDADKGHEAWVGLVAGQLRDNLGWEVERRALPRSAYLRWLERPDALFRATWVSDYPSPDTVLAPLFHSGSVGGGGNYTGYRNARVDALIDSARGLSDPGARRSRYREAEAAVCADLPVLPLWYGVTRHLIAGPVTAGDGVLIDLFGAPSPRAFGRSET
ncbi:peptide ABC transporter substrate-binding protein [Streptomyces eurythermus]|uniref:peptide ABC transporter substrate-binding protein n=1 Tax=Streptomyces eurythermus TaxID=42237 RepID=UPI0036F6C49B